LPRVSSISKVEIISIEQKQSFKVEDDNMDSDDDSDDQDAQL
jgi:hypothetical protein